MAATDATQNDMLRQLMPAFIQPLDGGHVSVHLIVPNPHQPRKLAERPFDPEHNPEDAQLVQSVREHGVIQPIGVIALPPDGDLRPDGHYQLVFGERRWRASLAAGRETIPALIMNTSGEINAEQQAVIALIENLQRADLTPDEICDGVERLHQVTGYSWERIAQMLGKSERTLRRYRRLSALPPDIRAVAIEARLSAAQIDALASVSADKQAELLRQIVELGLPGSASREAAQTIMQDASASIGAVARQVAGGHKRRSLLAGKSKAWAISPMHAQVVEALLAPADPVPQRKAAATKRIKALLELVEAMRLDLVDTRNAALLMSFDPNLPSPSAVAMAQSVRATRIGKALASIEAGLDLVEGSHDLSGNEEHAVMAILAHLQERIKELSGRKRTRHGTKS
jgi:ParB/RepB/Spo0J family partition protein